MLTLLAEKLLEKEVIFKEDLETIFGKRPFDKEELPLIQQDDKNASSTTASSASSEEKGDKEDKSPASEKSENGKITPLDTLF